MTTIKIQNNFDRELKKPIKDSYNLRESEKVFAGRLELSKKKDEVWINTSMSFVAFKSNLDLASQNLLRNHNGKILKVEVELDVDKYNDRTFPKIILRKVEPFEKPITKQHFQEKVEDNVDEEIPF